jgi:hypothetical protein
MVRKAAAAPPVDDGLVDIVEAAEVIFADDKVDTNWADGGLYVRISRIIESLPDLKPGGENKFFNYRFITDKQVLGILRPRLSRARIVIVPETVEEIDNQTLTTAKGGTSYMSRIRVTWRVVDGIGGESFTGQSLGYGDDSGDKGANKAFTAALKNFLLKLFEIGGDTDDLEGDEEADKRAKTRESGSRRVETAAIGDATVEGVERGGKAKGATEAQVARVGQYIRDLTMDAEAFSAFLKRKFNLDLALGDDPWVAVKNILEGMTGVQIGKVIAALDELYNTVEAQTEPDESYPA